MKIHRATLSIAVLAVFITFFGCSTVRDSPQLDSDTTAGISRAELQEIVIDSLKGHGFVVASVDTAKVVSGWKRYPVGQRGFLFWRKDWEQRTRLTITLEDDRFGDGYGIKVESETQDSVLDKEYWEDVTRATAQETELVDGLVDAILQAIRSRHRGQHEQ